MFNKIFKASHFCYDWQEYASSAVAPVRACVWDLPHPARGNTLAGLHCTRHTREQPIIFVNHFPLNQDLSNWYEVTDILKTRNVLVALAGHLHVNRAYDAEGIPAVIGRSSLRRKDPIGGYNLVTVGKDSITFCERIIKTETRPHGMLSACMRQPSPHRALRAKRKIPFTSARISASTTLILPSVKCGNRKM